MYSQCAWLVDHQSPKVKPVSVSILYHAGAWKDEVRESSKREANAADTRK